MPNLLFEIFIALRTRATRCRRAGSGISMLPVSIPAMLKVLLVATSVISRCEISGATFARMVWLCPGMIRS